MRGPRQRGGISGARPLRAVRQPRPPGHAGGGGPGGRGVHSGDPCRAGGGAHQRPRLQRPLHRALPRPHRYGASVPSSLLPV
eukprot:7818161-Pyramimonas_sp.AAC.1